MNFVQRRRPELPGFQITPMIDIVFNLLFFAMISQIFAQWEMEIQVKVPTARTGEVIDRLPGEVILNIQKDGRVIVNKQELDEAGLRSILERIVRIFPGQPVLIRADRETPYAHVIRILDLCRQCDIYNISFATSASEET